MMTGGQMPLRHGVHAQLEAEANRLIKESLAGVTRHSDKADILTPWKEQDRYRKEVYVTSGIPDASTRKGMFHRRLNAARPELNSRDGVARPRTVGNPTSASGLYDFVFGDDDA